MGNKFFGPHWTKEENTSKKHNWGRASMPHVLSFFTFMPNSLLLFTAFAFTAFAFSASYIKKKKKEKNPLTLFNTLDPQKMTDGKKEGEEYKY